ncbi:MAG: L,D-peptidoglycan transpeptidase YkuD (ErfK/YbiS/YcfS/YnhG family) [Verrucomicrobiales bacterium]|jgi:L,D-peptidoglycan transpeptidase YkuD (ErfK/YbiS/YcfS/YnhG family)
MNRILIVPFLTLLFTLQALGQGRPEIPPQVGQLVLSIADSWNSSRAKLYCFQRASANQPWQPAVFTKPVNVLLGKNGLAWGLGVLPNPPSKAANKREGDRRAPAGCFAIGKLYGYPKTVPQGGNYPYRQVTKWDAWIDDPKNPYYNQHFIADPSNVPPWFEKQRMRLGDSAYKYMLEVRHNTNPPQAGAGSAIFFHTRRGPDRVTSGCTTMALSNLDILIKWLRAQQSPHYVLLPNAEYQQLAPIWHLPVIQQAAKSTR